ncbi:hypothetical protein N7488_011383 [Penicillium malachiteum]|nr:hypothetical protein N7488_011383 [Penicillium malachiteum]
MSQFSVPFVASMHSYLDSQYISAPAPMMEHSPSQLDNMSRSSLQRNIPPSPASSTSEFKVSKAKKGKRVHACEFPGCVKVFTRAEHRRRHELSHRSKKTYVCSYEGCAKAFHRSDYLTQHMARHDPESTPVSKSPSLRSNSTSSAVSVQTPVYSKSPVLASFHSPVASASPKVLATEQPVMICSNCFNCQNQANASPGQGPPLYYPGGSSMNLFGSQSAPGGQAGLEAIIDQYMRSVLRPDAFLPVHSQEQLNPPFWASNIDPNLPTMNSSSFQSPPHYPWSTEAESLPQVQAAHGMPENQRLRERDS